MHFYNSHHWKKLLPFQAQTDEFLEAQSVLSVARIFKPAFFARAATPAVLCVCALYSCQNSAYGEELFKEAFSSGNLERWQIKEGKWTVKDGQAIAEGGFSMLLVNGQQPHDFELAADVAYSHTEAQAAAGIAFRLGEDSTGYLAGLREIEKGVNPQSGPWERPVIQLFRKDQDGWKLLQESKVMGCRSGLLRHLKVVCRGPNIWVFYEDMTTPILSEFDDKFDRAGAIGLWKDNVGSGVYDNVAISSVAATPPLPLRTDWSWVRGAVYVRSDAVNSVQMWEDYWDHTRVIERELECASRYGFNMVQVYLHWIVWDKHKDEYLKRIDDFLARAKKASLKVNFIFWDDCGHVEPSLTFARPVPGRHNSQMMPNPSHKIRDSASELEAHKDRFRDYVESIARHYKSDDGIVFWQLYNECMGPTEAYRTGEADANLNRLLGWTREWVKGTGTQIPVTATGGGFYGPMYSDFYTYHSYAGPGQPLPNADGGPEHLCTETLNRPNASIENCLRGLAGKKNGFVIWELMIGRDNCRFPWGHPDGSEEPLQPFHGFIYPDGHPWDTGELKMLLDKGTGGGAAAFASLENKLFHVEYFDVEFKTSKKTSLTPFIDFDLGDEPGSGSPDATTGLGKDNFSIRWTGHLLAPTSGTYTLSADCDGLLKLWIDKTQLINKEDAGRREVQGHIELAAGQPYQIQVEYIHRTGAASNHVYWSGPNFKKQILQPDSAVAGDK